MIDTLEALYDKEVSRKRFLMSKIQSLIYLFYESEDELKSSKLHK